MNEKLSVFLPSKLQGKNPDNFLFILEKKSKINMQKRILKIGVVSSCQKLGIILEYDGWMSQSVGFGQVWPGPELRMNCGLVYVRYWTKFLDIYW